MGGVKSNKKLPFGNIVNIQFNEILQYFPVQPF